MPERGLILIAEDEADHIFIIRRAFKQAALANPIHVVRNGEEAIQYLQGVGPYSNRAEYPLPALLLLDLKMPRKNGFEVLEWIRLHPGLRRLRVVVLTTSSSLHDVNRAYQLGANSFLVKPTDFESVVRLVSLLKDYWVKMDKVPEIKRSENTPSSALRPLNEFPGSPEDLL